MANKYEYEYFVYPQAPKLKVKQKIRCLRWNGTHS